MNTLCTSRSENGPGEFIAIGNGDSTNHESFQAKERKIFSGMTLVVIRSLNGKAGTLNLIAESEQL